jgi:DNA-binding NarL/FixJ family response regulator
VLGLLASESVDLLISDMGRQQDPEAGLKLLKRLRAAPEMPPVIFYVGAQNTNLFEQAKMMGATAVVTTPTDLLAAVRSALAPEKAGLNRLGRVKGKLL